MKTPAICLLLLSLVMLPTPAVATGKMLTVMVLGDSLSAGYGLAREEAFPAQLQTALKQEGYQIQMINAGLSGDTSAGGVSRLEWSLSDDPDLVIVALGANDALRGLDPEQTFANLASIMTRLQQRGIAMVLAGMLAPRNLGEHYYSSFDAIYPALAQQFEVPLYPFFLEGVAAKPELNIADGIHPNAAGVKIMVDGMLPLVRTELDQLRSRFDR